MPVATANGKRFTFPEGTTPEQMGQAIDEYFQAAPAQAPEAVETAPEQPAQPEGRPESTESDKVSTRRGMRTKGGAERSGIADAALTLATGAAAEPVAGLAGIAAIPFVGSEAGDVVNRVRDLLTMQPKTEEGQQALQKVGEFLRPLTDALADAEDSLGDAGYEAGGPVAGAIGKTLPTAALELLGVGLARGGARAASKADDLARATPDPIKQAIVDTGKEVGLPVLNTDVNPPSSYAGRLAQSLSEKLGPLGSGTARAKQQRVRESIIENMAEEFDIELQSPFAEQIVQNIKSESARKLAKAEDLRNSAIDRLTQFGEVPLSRSNAAVQRQAEKQARLKDVGSPEIIDEMRDYLSAVEGADFDQLKTVRIELIRDIKALERAGDSPQAQRRLPALKSLKSAIDEDMNAFAKSVDRTAAADWLRANREFADELSKTKQTELKRVLQKGDATPEQVLTIMRGGKKSELARLKSSLDGQGIAAARASIIRDILDESGFFAGNINPNRVATSLGKTKRQQAIDVFFDEAGKARLDGLRQLLDATRRAQDFNINPPTGQQLVPFAAAGGIGGGLSVAPLTTIATTGSMAVIAKAYESRAMRNLLMRIGRSKKGSAESKRLLDAAATALIAEIQASKQEQQQQQQ